MNENALEETGQDRHDGTVTTQIHLGCFIWVWKYAIFGTYVQINSLRTSSN